MLRTFTFLCGTALAGAAFADPVSVETARGPAELDATPQSVIAYDVAAIDTLDALGIVPAGVPEKLYVDYLDDVAAAAEPVGTLFEPDFEAVNALAPDLVIVGGRSSDQLEPMQRIAPAIDMTIGSDSLVETGLARLAAYGTLFGREAEAEALASDFETKLEAARAAVAGKGDALIVMTNGPKVSAFGAGSRFGWIHGALALPEAAPDVDSATHGEAISFEFIAEANPDWLIVIDRSAAVGDEGPRDSATLDNALVAGTTAWSAGQVVYLDPAPAYIAGGGIQALGRTLDRVIEGFGAGS